MPRDDDSRLEIAPGTGGNRIAAAFTYGKLPTQQSFRLFKLSGHQSNGLPTFEISEHNFNAAPRYRALSYCWGTLDNPKEILLNGKTICLHQSLWSFLQQLSRNNDFEYYWADALCINQQDMAERSHQVSNMAEIYLSAGEVVVWLEAYHERSLRELEDYCKQHPTDDWSSHHSQIIDASGNCYNLLLADYWRRAWIVQEIALDLTKVNLTCGSKSVSLDWFMKMCRRFRMGMHDEADTEREFLQAYDLIEYVQLGIDFDFLSAFRDLRELRCTDLRDSVYSLLGLYRKRSLTYDPRYVIEVDYTKSLMTVRWDCAMMLLLSRKGLPARDIHQLPYNIVNWIYWGSFKQYDTPFGPERSTNVFISLATYAVDLEVRREFRDLASIIVRTVLAIQITRRRFCQPDDDHHPGYQIDAFCPKPPTTSDIEVEWLACEVGLLLAKHHAHSCRVVADAISHFRWICNTCGSERDCISSDRLELDEADCMACSELSTISELIPNAKPQDLNSYRFCPEKQEHHYQWEAGDLAFKATWMFSKGRDFVSNVKDGLMLVHEYESGYKDKGSRATRSIHAAWTQVGPGFSLIFRPDLYWVKHADTYVRGKSVYTEPWYMVKKLMSEDWEDDRLANVEGVHLPLLDWCCSEMQQEPRRQSCMKEVEKFLLSTRLLFYSPTLTESLQDSIEG